MDERRNAETRHGGCRRERRDLLLLGLFLQRKLRNVAIPGRRAPISLPTFPRSEPCQTNSTPVHRDTHVRLAMIGAQASGEREYIFSRALVSKMVSAGERESEMTRKIYSRESSPERSSSHGYRSTRCFQPFPVQVLSDYSAIKQEKDTSSDNYHRNPTDFYDSNQLIWFVTARIHGLLPKVLVRMISSILAMFIKKLSDLDVS
ncbi:hypothetical protein ALC57_06693 [Trachymyrmex cornetzi]|uniref:Uncharacterized protein n=1 Tax=Trachymyrmex cornetzi TaxID=471704 RepID=A0A195E7F3_9HYME|nr:hypothetical protein ALC57_06693 [Trachymyrmex cornetzi]